jgi:hypothetical protein
MRIPLPRKKARVAFVVATATVLVAGAGVAWASIPDSSGVIHGCYATSGGALRVIDSAKTSCKGTEKSLTWNRRGPAGPQGPAGPAGPPGGVTGYLLKSDTLTLGPGQNGTRQVQCDGDRLPLGGGYQAPPNTFRADKDYPVFIPGFNGWNVTGQDLDSVPITITVYVVCAHASS